MNQNVDEWKETNEEIRGFVEKNIKAKKISKLTFKAS